MGIEEAGTQLQQFLQEMVEQMVEKPEEVRIVMGRIDGCVTYDVRVAKLDVGRLIGRQGRTAKSIRTIVAAAAARSGLRFDLTLPRSGNGGSER